MMGDVGDRLGVGAVLLGLGMAEQSRGQGDEAERHIVEAQTQLREGGGGQGLSWGLSNALIDTRTHDLLVDAAHRYQAGLDLPATDWTQMVLADWKAWRARSKSNS
jgi:hypothetical protein